MSQCPRRYVLKDHQECRRRQSSPLKCIRRFPLDSGGRGFFDLHQAAEDDRADGGLRRHLQIPIAISGKKFCVALQFGVRPARAVVGCVAEVTKRQCGSMNLANGAPSLLP